MWNICETYSHFGNGKWCDRSRRGLFSIPAILSHRLSRGCQSLKTDLDGGRSTITNPAITLSPAQPIQSIEISNTPPSGSSNHPGIRQLKSKVIRSSQEIIQTNYRWKLPYDMHSKHVGNFFSFYFRILGGGNSSDGTTSPASPTSLFLIPFFVFLLLLLFQLMKWKHFSNLNMYVFI